MTRKASLQQLNHLLEQALLRVLIGELLLPNSERIASLCHNETHPLISLLVKTHTDAIYSLAKKS